MTTDDRDDDQPAAHVADAAPAVLWCLHDGKPGHRNQIRGLAQAINEIHPVTAVDITVRRRWEPWINWMLRRFPPGAALPAPDLIIGAGHSTHPAVLAAKRRYGGRSIIMMRPTLPISSFDLCIVPMHDGLSDGPRVLTTRGAINVMTPRREPPGDGGMLMLGGPSAHHRWPQDRVLEQVRAIVFGRPSIAWTLTTSRRTPAATLTALRSMQLPGLEIVPGDETEPDWLPRMLARAREAWITEDSVSMVYEALTSGAAAGLIELERSGTSRISRGLDDLISTGWVTPLRAHDAARDLPEPKVALHEAARCATALFERGLLPPAAAPGNAQRGPTSPESRGGARP